MSDNLPKNRKQLFKYLASRWDAVLSVSLLVTLLAVPLIAVIMVQSAVCANITLQMNQAPDNEKAVYVLRLLRAQSVGALVSVVGFYPLCLGLNGAFRYYKRTVWAEGATIRDDFWQGVKDKPWKNAVIFALPGVAVWCVEFVFVYVPSVEMSACQRMLMYGFSVLLVAYVAAVCVFFAVQNAVYDVGFFACFKNSLVLALKGLLPVVGFVAVAVLPQTVPFFFYNTVVDVVGYAVVALFGVGYATLVLTLVADYVLDKEINSVNYPQIVDKGIVRNK